MDKLPPRQPEDFATRPCAFCGDPDASHRVRDAVLSRFLAGDTLESLAWDYGETREDIEALMRQSVIEGRG